MKSKYKIKNTKITIFSPEKPEKNNLKALYDTMNELAINLKQKGMDISNMFYSDEEFKKIRLDKENIFIN